MAPFLSGQLSPYLGGGAAFAPMQRPMVAPQAMPPGIGGPVAQPPVGIPPGAQAAGAPNIQALLAAIQARGGMPGMRPMPVGGAPMGTLGAGFGQGFGTPTPYLGSGFSPLGAQSMR